MATPLVDITPIVNSLIGLLTPLLQLVVVFSLLKLVIGLVTSLRIT